jgi:hypothetical protein
MKRGGLSRPEAGLDRELEALSISSLGGLDVVL